jgi:hypothetical protein
MTTSRFVGDRFLTIQQSARLIGGFCWLERHVFETLGQWSTFESDDGAALAFASASLRHGAHSELWTERLPSARGLDTGDLVTAPSVRALDVVGALQGLDQPEATAGRLESWFGLVLPALIEAYASLLREVSPVAESPMRRALTVVLDDDRREFEDGLVLLGAVGHPDAAQVASTIPPLDAGSWFLAEAGDLA